MAILESISKSTALGLSWTSTLAALILDRDTKALFILGAVFLVQAAINFALTTYRWHVINKFKEIDTNGEQLPPQYPYLIPYLGSTLSFIWNNVNLARRAT
jgi:hypothetical protein